jgi:hypothetical protein
MPVDPSLVGEYDVGRVIERLGGWEAVLKRMAEFEKVTSRMFSEEDELTQKYPYKWVAVGKDGLLEVGDTMEEVFAAVEARGLKNPEFVVRFLDPDPLDLVL